MKTLNSAETSPKDKPLACQHHNHSHCIADALAAARDLCASNGVRLTSQREKVLELIWQSHKPLGAYTLMDMLAETAGKRVAPPTVYRALDFLLEQRLIHRINSLNAYLGCPSPGVNHPSHFFICRACGIAVESGAENIADSLTDAAKNAGFSCESQSVEIVGLCPSCQAQPAASALDPQA